MERNIIEEFSPHNPILNTILILKEHYQLFNYKNEPVKDFTEYINDADFTIRLAQKDE